MADTPKKKPAAKKLPAKVAAAVAEVEDPGTITVPWYGLQLEIPSQAPEEMLLDLVEWEASGDGNAMVIGRILRSILGPAQFLRCRNRIAELRAEDPESDRSYLVELVQEVMRPLGVDLGESEASQDS